jgi:hypothetical protein
MASAWVVRAASAVDLVADLADPVAMLSAITGREELAAELADWVAMRLPSAVGPAVRVVPVADRAAGVVDAVAVAVAADVAVVASAVGDAGAVAAGAAVRLWPTAEVSSGIASTAGVGSSFV